MIFLFSGLARAGDGTSEFTVEGEMIAPKVIKQLKHCLQPNLNNIRIDWGSEVDINNSIQAPSIIPQLYDGFRIQIFKLFKQNVQVPNSIEVSANINFEKEAYKEKVVVEESSLENDLLQSLHVFLIEPDFFDVDLHFRCFLKLLSAVDSG